MVCTSLFGVGLLVGGLCLSVACLNNFREVVPQVVPQSSNNDEVISDTEGIRVSSLVEDNDMPPSFVLLVFLILDEVEVVAFDNSFKIDIVRGRVVSSSYYVFTSYVHIMCSHLMYIS